MNETPARRDDARAFFMDCMCCGRRIHISFTDYVCRDWRKINWFSDSIIFFIPILVRPVG